ncbi:hypothetical protein CJ030_MR3G014509 [Morella rubra]|uniref:Photosynthetic NDH subunit of subcomplex B 5, chloroplastic n=1 Tax=Morella rubra TaxID=262757 RepID=A0A6A1VYQ9_9ROSI|nr:hypothetical protein CJ030_MR3G014509 [Morella rubra]
MAVCYSFLSVLSAVSGSKLSSNHLETRIRSGGFNPTKSLAPMPSKTYGNPWKNGRPTKLNRAGLSEIEPDLNEDPVDRWATNSVDPEDFKYGEYDGHHTYHEGEEKGFISSGIAAGMFFHMVYLLIATGLFMTVFTIIEMDKPDKPHNFEPQIYNMERGARDKLIADYNTMSIWDFNEKYEDLWDFTVTKDDITKR